MSNCSSFNENALSADEREAMDLVADMIRSQWMQDANSWLDEAMGEY